MKNTDKQTEGWVKVIRGAKSRLLNPSPNDLRIRLLNAITEAVREIERSPDDSMQDIFNEALKTWETGLKMNHRYELKTDDVAEPSNVPMSEPPTKTL